MAELTQAMLKEMLGYDPLTGIFVWRVTKSNRAVMGKVAGYRQPSGYWAIKALGKLYRGHRLAWLWMYGRWPACEVDHVDRNRANNSFDNLRLATRQENMRNTDSKGYRSRAGKWRAHITVSGRTIELGSFDTPAEARAAYLVARVVHFNDTSWMRS